MQHNPSSGKAQQAALALAALGVVYGDIGTSPLYTIKEVFGGHQGLPVTPDNILGILSLVLWALIIIVSVKYVIFVMQAHNKGEGGIMALIALSLRDAKNSPKRAKWIMVAGLFGAGMFYGDGIVTPAISVLSALEGMSVATPTLSPFVLPVTVIVILLLFYVQHKGTASVGAFFGPIMMVWFVTIASLGVYHIADNPHVFWAINPWYGIRFLFENSRYGVIAMGAVILAITGAEALYADMGHFGPKPIRQAWFSFVLPSLVLNYFGQGALLLRNPAAVDNPFYRLAPDWFLYPLVALATVATVIASQAVISGAYSITRQAMQLGFLPRFEVRYTSEQTQGQIYLPIVNWLLCAAVLVLVLSFQSSAKLAGAYGIAVTSDMVITSFLAICVAAKTWRWGFAKATALFACFLVVEFAFLFSNLKKVPDGGWFPLLVGALLFLLMATWKKGSSLLSSLIAKDAIPLSDFIAALLIAPPQRVEGTAIFMTSHLERVPNALLHNMMHNRVLHERVVILSVQMDDTPYVPEEERVELSALDGGFYRITLHFGFKDKPDVPAALVLCEKEGVCFDMMETSFFLGRARILARMGSGMAFWREQLFIFLFRNASSATDFYKIPSNRVVELGTQVSL